MLIFSLFHVTRQDAESLAPCLCLQRSGTEAVMGLWWGSPVQQCCAVAVGVVSTSTATTWQGQHVCRLAVWACLKTDEVVLGARVADCRWLCKAKLVQHG